MKFFRQYSIGPYILDFYCPNMKLAVELDGGQHNQSESKEYEAVRTKYLKVQRIEVMRFWNNEVLLDVQSVLAELPLKVTPPIPPLSPLNVRGDEGGLRGRIQTGPTEIPEGPKL